MTGPTAFPELDELLEEFVGGVAAVLGEKLCGVYLQGSFAVGDADEHSDVDFIVVTHASLAPGDPAALQAVQERIYAMPATWAQHLEGTYVTCELLRRVDPERTPLLYFDNGSTEYAWDNHCNTAVVRWSLREHGVALVGPPPSSLVDPVSADDLRAEMLWALGDWDRWLADRDLKSRRYQGLIVLTICRMLHTLEFGRVGSKREAGESAISALPQWSDLVRAALDDRPDPWRKVREPADPGLMARTYAFLDYALSRARS
jgi:predicted nucleotidyltransferase